MLGWILGCMDYGVVQPDTAPADTGTSPAPALDSASLVDTGTPPAEDCSDFSPAAPAPVTIDTTCLRTTPLGDIAPVIEWRTDAMTFSVQPGRDNAVSTPALGHLNDDDGDGVIGDGDAPDLVAVFYSSGLTSAGVLRAISGDGSAEHWSLDAVVCEGDTLELSSAGGVAIGDLEGDGEPDVIAMSLDGRVIALDSSGAVKWCSESSFGPRAYPSLADVDGDGQSEVLVGPLFLSSTGAELGYGEEGMGGTQRDKGKAISYAVDLDLDGVTEIVAGNTLYRVDGSVVAQTGGADGFTAVGNFDDDERGELVVVAPKEGVVYLYDYTDIGFSLMWSYALEGAGGETLHGGPPTVADFDGDGEAEIGVAGSDYYTVLEGSGAPLWMQEITDVSSAITGSSVFDFDADGVAEVVYGDEDTLWIFDGATGAVRYADDRTGSRTQLEYPIIADVDANGSTEVVFAANDDKYDSDYAGLVILGSGGDAWAAARQVWNQHAYFITNVGDDGEIPANAEANWLRWNTFRAGGTAAGPEHWLADLSLGEVDACLRTCDDGQVTLSLPIANRGGAEAGPITVTWIADGVTLRQDAIPLLAPGATALLPPLSVDEQSWGAALEVRISSEAQECDTDNNTLSLGGWLCDDPR